MWRRRVCAWSDARGPQLGLWAFLRVVTGGSRWAAGPGSCPNIRRAGQVSPPLLPWDTKTRPCRRGLGAAEGRGGPGNPLEAEPQSPHPRTPARTLLGVGGTRPSRPRQGTLGRDGPACAPLAPHSAAGQEQADRGRTCGPWPPSPAEEPGDNKLCHLIYMTKCRHYCRLTECRSGQFPKII